MSGFKIDLKDGAEYNVAGIKYVVKNKENLAHDHDIYGQVVYGRSVIHLEKAMSQERTEQVLVHELLHAMFYEAGFHEQDEDVINRVGKVLYMFLKSNGGAENEKR